MNGSRTDKTRRFEGSVWFEGSAGLKTFVEKFGLQCVEFYPKKLNKLPSKQTNRRKDAKLAEGKK